MRLLCLPAVLQWLHEQEFLFFTLAVTHFHCDSFVSLIFMDVSQCWKAGSEMLDFTNSCGIVAVHVPWDPLKGRGSHPKC